MAFQCWGDDRGVALVMRRNTLIVRNRCDKQAICPAFINHSAWLCVMS